MAFGKTLQALRKDRGWSQARLADESGVTQQLISQIERDVNHSTKELPALARALGVGLGDIDPSYDLSTGGPAGVTAWEGPLLNWVSAGQLSSDSAVDEAIGTARAVLPAGDWIALRVEGESMDRISPPGSIIFVDRADKRLVTGGFYVIDDGEGGTTYKRFQARPMRFEPVSKNKDLPTLYPDNEPTIVGRVKLTTLSLT